MIQSDDFERWTSVERADLGEWIAEMDGSTRLTWLWAILLGPVYFLAHGFHRQALLVLALDLILIGVLLAPFLAHRAWRDRARSDACWLQEILDARGSVTGHLPA